MGTRGAYGFRIGGKDKVTYNHSDSYPSWLGKAIVEFIKDTPLDKLKEIAERIQLVSEKKPPTKEEQAKYAALMNANVSSGDPNEWYVLLRELQGNLGVYRETDLDVMIDGKPFLKDGLFCEYAYIINIDDGVLEYYEGVNTKKYENAGRYFGSKPKEGYYGVRLVGTAPLTEVHAGEFEFPNED